MANSRGVFLALSVGGAARYSPLKLAYIENQNMPRMPPTMEASRW